MAQNLVILTDCGNFFLKHFGFPGFFFVGWKGKGGSLVTFLSWFLLQQNLGKGSEPIGPLSLVSPSQCCFSLFFTFFLEYGTWSQTVEIRDKRLTHLYPINRRSQWQIKGRGPGGPGGRAPYLLLDQTEVRKKLALVASLQFTVLF